MKTVLTNKPAAPVSEAKQIYAAATKLARYSGDVADLGVIRNVALAALCTQYEKAKTMKDRVYIARVVIEAEKLDRVEFV